MEPVFDVFNPPFKFFDLFNASKQTNPSNMTDRYEDVSKYNEFYTMEIEEWLDRFMKAYNLDQQRFVWSDRYPRIAGKAIIKWSSQNPPKYADGVPFWTPGSKIVFTNN